MRALPLAKIIVTFNSQNNQHRNTKAVWFRTSSAFSIDQQKLRKQLIIILKERCQSNAVFMPPGEILEFLRCASTAICIIASNQFLDIIFVIVFI